MIPFPSRWMFWKWKARLKCHYTKWCCQYVDKPMCNSWGDPHPDARWRFRYRTRVHVRKGWE